jgi:negative regulator of sigma E activity
MGILETLGIVLGSGGIGSFITWAVHLKAEKRLKKAQAAQAESTLESMNIANKRDKFEALYVQITKMMHDYNTLSDDYREYR